MVKQHPDLVASGLPAVLRVPTWARARGDVQRDVDAAYIAGAALNSLDILVRGAPAWAGVWRQRLALRSASAGAKLLGRKEDEGALRDTHFFRTPGDERGPAGNLLLAWRRLAGRSPGLDEAALRPVADELQVTWDDPLAEVIANAEDLAASTRPAPLLAAELAAEIYRARPDAELLGFWVADALLAKKLRWPVPVPLLMAQANSLAFKTGEGRRRVRAGGEGWGRAVLLAYAQAAAEACDLGVELAGRAEHLVNVAPKLRAKGASEVLRLLLEDDAVPSSNSGTSLTDRSARRLFERLRKLGAVRELSGRSTFRLYGL